MIDQSDIFAPLFCMIALTASVWVFMYSKRIPFIRRNDFGPEQFRPGEFERLSPADVRQPSDNFRNLFEIPVLFYVLCLYLFVTGQVDSLYLIAAWAFVGIRVLHSLVHCTVNIVLLRFALYAVSTCTVWFIALRAGLQYVLAQ